jgi:tetratricopeptide (TPR) repeat protein
MKFKVIAVLFLAGGLAFLLFMKFNPSNTSQEISPSTSEPKVTLKNRLQNPASKPLLTNAVELAKSESFNPDCIAEIQSVAELDLNHVSANLVFELAKNSKCNNLPAYLTEAQKLFASTCGVETNTNITDACASALFLYRSLITNFATRDTDPKDINDPKILFEKIYAKLSQSEIDFESITPLTDRYLELEPDSKEVQRIALLAKLFELESNSNNQKDNALKTELEAIFDKYSDQSTTSDPKVLELGIYLRTNGFTDAQSLLNESQKIITTRPEFSDLGYYLRSSVLWRDGKKTEALEEVQKALALKPKDPRYLETFNKLKKMEPGEKGAYSMSFDASLSVDLNKN